MSARRKAPEPLGAEQVPSDHEAERAVLGACLVDGRRAVERAAQICGAGDLHEPRHQRIFAVMVELLESGAEVDVVMVNAQLARALSVPESWGGPAYLGSLIDGVPRSTNVEHYARVVKDRAVRRELMDNAIEYAHSCSNGHTTQELVDVGAKLYRACLAADPAAVRRVRPTQELAAAYSADVRRGPSRRLWTGLGPIDTATRGIAPGEVVTGVARPAVGKSVIASQVLTNVAAQGEPCAFFSLEMPAHQAFERMVRQRLCLTQGEVEEAARQDWANLRPEQREALDGLSRNMVIIDRGKSGVADLDASMSEASAILGRPPRLVVIDYLGLLGSGAKNLRLYERVSEAAVDCKSFSKRHGVALVLLSQAGRDPDPEVSEGAKALGLDAARDSGQVEEAADFVITLWRPELSSRLKPEDRREVAGQLWAAVVKNRRGPLSRFRLLFDSRTLEITDWPEET